MSDTTDIADKDANTIDVTHAIDGTTHALPGSSVGYGAGQPAGDDLALPSQRAVDIPAAPVSVSAVESTKELVDHGEIARGGMGSIRHAYDTRLRRQLALKRLSSGFADVNDAQVRFLEEAQITGQLDHPNIVPVHELGEDSGGNLYFTMKLVRGQTLGEMLSQMGPAWLLSSNLERLINVLLKVCDALAFAHERGVIHRDLKPNNIMVGSHGQVYVMDWGLAALSDGERLASDAGKVVGTPGYMSPEQARGDDSPIDHRCDVYSLGAILYRVLTQERPHPGHAGYAVVQHTRVGKILPPQQVVPEVVLPPELCRIAMTALQHRPEDRYQSMLEMRSDLGQFLRGGGWLQTRTIPAGTLIIEQGAEAHEAYIVVSGSCEAFKEVADRRLSLRIMGPGEVFGETALLTKKPRTANVVALEETVIKVVTQQSLERELQQNQWLATFIKTLADRFCDIDAKLSQLRIEKLAAADDSSADDKASEP